MVRWFLGFIIVYGIFNNTHNLKPIICQEREDECKMIMIQYWMQHCQYKNDEIEEPWARNFEENVEEN